MKLKVILIAVASLVGLFLLGLVFGSTRQALHTTESPAKRYYVKITEKRFLIERAVYLNVTRAGDPLVAGKLLYTGDFLDNDFRDLYPNYAWLSESVLEIGRNDKYKAASLRVVNETEKKIAYLLIETYDDKFVVFDVEPGANLTLSFAYSGQLSCQGEFASSRERFGAAAKLSEGESPKGIGEFVVRVSVNRVDIEDQQSDLVPIDCCAADRPGFDYELLY